MFDMAKPRPNAPVTATPAAPAAAVSAAPNLEGTSTVINSPPNSAAPDIWAPATPAATPADDTQTVAEPRKVRKTRTPGVIVAHLYRDAPIDDNVPVPVNVRTTGSGGVGRQTGYPFARLVKDGQSFFVPKSSQNALPVQRLSSSVASMNKKTRPLGFQFVVMPFTQSGPDGLSVEGARVWRVAYTVPAPTPEATPAA